MSDEDLIQLARQAREQAYAPYSSFPVGAALLTKSGLVYTGSNIENLSYGLTVCAERIAVFAAICGGHRQFAKLAIVADSRVPVSPCGACRQVLAEFAPELFIVCANLEGEIFRATLAELLPRAKEGILDR